MPSALSLPGNRKKSSKILRMILRRNAGPGIGHAYFDCVRSTCRTLAALSGYGWLAGETPFPHIRLPLQPRLYPLGSELRCILQEIGNHALHFG